MNVINKIAEEQKKTWLKLISSISEGVLVKNILPEQDTNLFGRKVNFSSSGDVAFIAGLSATGLRATAWLDENELYINANNLRQAARLHLPLVIVIESDNEYSVQEFVAKNAFQLKAGTFSELIDYTILAHKIAETTLIPGIVVFKGNYKNEIINSAGKNILFDFLGNPDDKISTPTPAQEIIFGKQRRRIVNWFNFDVPVLSGAKKNGRGMAYEIAANEFYFKSTLENYIYSAFDEFSLKTGRKYKPSFVVNRQQEFQPDIPFSLESSRFPKHEILIQTINREFPQLKNIRIKNKNEINYQSTDNNISIALKNYIDKGPAYSRLSNFRENIMMFYGNERSEWIADPFQAIPVMPPATANLTRVKADRKLLPVVDFEKFGECSDCTLYCPHAAIMTTALSVEGFIKSGIRQAQDTGFQFSQIIPFQKNWIKLSNRKISQHTFNSYFLKEILPASFHELLEQMKVEGDKQQNLLNEMDKILHFIGDVKIIITEKIFRERNKTDNNSGELLAVAIDSNSCTGCGLCADLSENNSILMEDETTELIEEIKNNYSLWEKLPDTSSDTIERLIDDKDFSSLEAILLSRNFNLSLTGGNRNEIDTNAKSVLHLVSAVAETVVQPAYKKLIDSIEDKLNALLENIKKQLSEALPVSNLNTISDLLTEFKGDKISINEIVSRGDRNRKLIDRSVLKRKIDLSEELSDLKKSMSTGVTGTGRSRYGMVLDSSLSSLAEYPYNNFTSPVILFEGSSPQLLSGLVEGHVRNAIDNFKLLRRADLEIQNKYVPAVHDHVIANLNWQKLTDAERSAIAPIMLVAKSGFFKNTGIFSFRELLGLAYPVKAIIIDDANPETDIFNHSTVNSFPQSLINSNNCFVAKSSLADPEQLFKGLITGLNYPGPALFWLLAPDSSKHHLKNLKKLNSLALNSRAFIQFDYSPAREGRMISSKTNIDSNTSVEDDWVAEKIFYSENGEEKQMNYSVTFADWAFSIDKLKNHFKIYDEGEGAATTVENYIKLDENSRTGKVPVIYRLNALKKIVRYSVSDFIIKATESTLYAWRSLREMAGTLTEFPEKLKQKVEKDVSERFASEKMKITNEFSEKFKSLEEDHLEKVRQKLKEKLLELSKRGEN